jgi:hypothetical protein
LQLSGPSGPVLVGAPVPIEIELRNEGPRAILIVGVVDGSEEGLRYPRWLPTVEGPDGRVPPPPSEDPLVAPLRESDFVRLPAGRGFDPTNGPASGANYLPLAAFASFSLPQPGAYRFGLELSTESESPDEWLGRFNQGSDRDRILGLVARVPRLTVASNVLEVSAVPRGSAPSGPAGVGRSSG